jgi:tetratricopeptide (TPR) repeat protein
MKDIRVKLLACFLVIFGLQSFCCAVDEQMYSLFNQANEAFRQANSTAGNQEAAQKLYEKAILCYEKVIADGRIQNAGLYYDVANAYLLKGDLGKAILNYRRAEKLDKSDRNIQTNLAFARGKRVDTIKEKTEKRMLQTLIFWHYDFSLKTRFVLACVFFAGFCAALMVNIWFGRRAPATMAAIICGVLTLCLAGSMTGEALQGQKERGVITAAEVAARQGDGLNYPTSFKDGLHAGVEFDLIEARPGWMHIRLSDGSDTWIPATSAEII